MEGGAFMSGKKEIRCTAEAVDSPQAEKKEAEFWTDVLERKVREAMEQSRTAGEDADETSAHREEC